MFVLLMLPFKVNITGKYAEKTGRAFKGAQETMWKIAVLCRSHRTKGVLLKHLPSGSPAQWTNVRD